MKILVIGYPGLLSADLVPILRADHEVITLTIQDLDITRKEEVFKTIENLQPELVVNCAGYTAVDEAEKNWEKAFQVNALGTHYLALACQRYRIILCHISTDYVLTAEAAVLINLGTRPIPSMFMGLPNEQGISMSRSC